MFEHGTFNMCTFLLEWKYFVISLLSKSEASHIMSEDSPIPSTLTAISVLILVNSFSFVQVLLKWKQMSFLAMGATWKPYRSWSLTFLRMEQEQSPQLMLQVRFPEGQLGEYRLLLGLPNSCLFHFINSLCTYWGMLRSLVSWREDVVSLYLIVT